MSLFALFFGLMSGCFLSVLVGIVGSKRRIGFGWAFLASLLLTPLVGLLLALISDPLPVGTDRGLGCIGTLFGVLGLAAVVLVHELAEIVVIANGVRAGRTTPLALATVDTAPSHTRAATVGAPS